MFISSFLFRWISRVILKKKTSIGRDLFCVVESTKYVSIGFTQIPLHDELFYIQIQEAKGEKIDRGQANFCVL